MKLLLENWRKFLLTEAAMTIEDLMNFKDDLDLDLEMYILVRKNQEGGIELSYASIDSHGDPYMLGNDAMVRGEVEIVPSGDGFDDIGPCEGAWQVKWSTATEGWGPLLYDVAIEYATKHGNGLIADREMISDKARAVWDYYLGQRGDVDNHQLDDLKNTLTPIEVDNCDQYIASVGGKYDWEENSLSKRYTKAPTTITELEKLGRFIDET